MSGEDYLLSLLTKKPESNYADNTFIEQRACPFIKYQKDRLSVKYTGKGLLYSDISSILANRPADRNTPIYYFEVKIKDLGNRGDISIGLAQADFPLNKHPGWTRKSFGYRADGKVCWAKQVSDLIMPKFTTGSVIGCGLNYFKREVFFTFNGQYYGPAFKDVELREYHAALSLHSLNEHVTFNFGSKPFTFDIDSMILEEKKEGIKSILNQPINYNSLHQIVHSYLTFHGYVNTLEAFEKSAKIERRDTGLPRKNVFEGNDEEQKELVDALNEKQDGDEIIGEEQNGDGKKKDEESPEKPAPKEMDIETKKENGDDKKEEEKDENARRMERFRSDSFNFESPYIGSLQREHSIDFEPFTLNGERNESFNLLRKASLMVDFNGNSNGLNGLIEKDGQLDKQKIPNHYLIYERAGIRQLIKQGKIQDTIDAIEKIFPGLLQENPKIAKVLYIQQFIEYIREKDIIKAIEYSQKQLTAFQKENVYNLDKNGIIQEVPIDTIMALLCYPDPENSDLKHLVDESHRELTADIVNQEVLSKMGFLNKSILDLLIAHLTVMEETFLEENDNYGEIFEFKV